MWLINHFFVFTMQFQYFAIFILQVWRSPSVWRNKTEDLSTLMWRTKRTCWRSMAPVAQRWWPWRRWRLERPTRQVFFCNIIWFNLAPRIQRFPCKRYHLFNLASRIRGCTSSTSRTPARPSRSRKRARFVCKSIMLDSHVVHQPFF